jgi:uncharacterized protein
MKTVEFDAGGVTLSANLFRPEIGAAPWPAIVVAHGFGSSKQSYAEYGEFMAPRSWAVLTLDLRGHGDSGGRLDGGLLDDLAAATAELRRVAWVDPERIVLRGTSFSGPVVIHAAVADPRVRAVIAVCPAGESLMLPRDQTAPFAVPQSPGLVVSLDAAGFAAYLRTHDVSRAVGLLSPRPLLLIQAKGDETVPWQSTRALYEAAGQPKRLVLLEGGSHRSAQHDPAVHAMELDWLAEVGA